MDGLKARLSFDAVAYDYDDEYLTIDTDTHIININNLSRLFGVQYDGNSKLIKFRISNKLSDIQKMQDSIVYINWIDSKGVKGQSIAIDKTISNDICEFAWKVPFDALKNSRVLHFAMSAVVTKNSSSVIDQRWSTQIASVIIPDGIYIKSYTPSSEEEDRIAQIYNELSRMINKLSENLQSQVNLLNEALVEQISAKFNVNKFPRNTEMFTNNGYFPQCFDISKDTGKVYVCANKTTNDGNGRIYTFDDLTFSNYTYHDFKLGHNNDCCYLNGYLYVCCGAQVGGQLLTGDVTANTVFKINLDSYVISNTFILSTLQAVNQICTDGTSIYVCDGIKLYETKDEFENLTQIGTGFDIPSADLNTNTTYGQTMAYFNNHIYKCFHSFISCDFRFYIVKYLKSGKILFKQSYSIPEISEAEGIMFTGGYLYTLESGTFMTINKFDFNNHIYGGSDFTRIYQNSDLNTLIASDKYFSAGGNITTTLSNVPFGVTSGFTLINIRQGSTNLRQFLFDNTENSGIYTRLFSNGTFFNWYKFEGVKLIS